MTQQDRSALGSRSSHFEGETVRCRLILTRNAHREFLVILDNGGLRLPELSIPRWERAAPHLASMSLAMWGVRPIVLFFVRPAEGEAGLLEPRYYVLEAEDPNATCTAGAQWIPAEDNGLDDPMLVRAIAEAKSYLGGGADQGFARSGWLRDLKPWIDRELAPKGLKLAGDVEQYVIGPGSCLIRLATTGPHIWFKAVPARNPSEYYVTRTVAGFAGDLLPEVFATRDDCRGWLALEAPGSHLDSEFRLDRWLAASRCLAELQLKSIAHTTALLDANARDLRTARLSARIPRLFERIAELMDHQLSTPPPVLRRSDLAWLSERLEQSCAELEQSRLPATLGQTDLNPGNVLACRTKSVFLDWTGAMIGHPFFTFEYLISLLRRLRPDLEHWVPLLRDAYVTPWRQFYRSEDFTTDFSRTPALAALAYALGATDWQSSFNEMRPEMPGLIRSLARRMHRELSRETFPGERR